MDGHDQIGWMACHGIGWHDMAWDEARRDGMASVGKGWDEMRWAGWDRMEWDRIAWMWIGWDGMGRCGMRVRWTRRGRMIIDGAEGDGAWGWDSVGWSGNRAVRDGVG